jgi:hypothetical protein
MQRPSSLFLVRATRGGSDSYMLVWKDGRRLSRLAAGVAANMLPGSTISYETAGDAPPTVQSVVADLENTADFAPNQCTLTAWDVSAHVGRHFPRMRFGEVVYGRFDMQENLTVEYCRLTAALASSTLAARLLFEELESICTVIEPDASQMAAYGHKLRLLLISACTEVESAWRSVFVANSSNPPDRLNTTHYVRLATPMKLRERRVLFTRVTPARELAPFATWDETRPTESLPWYTSYNATKHNRELHLDRATLGHVIDALGALYLMLMAQFGYEAKQALPSHPFFIEDGPEFDLQRYIQSPFDDGPWIENRFFG